ncbi:MAG: hypothetical protein A2017_18110 [Lentisphaerae bacterium GWF2_44_16]|nr:MAG: hypothetical protein A2017_18110 [Lentisphaerae bacterium GWF2_44_16]
MKSLTEILSGLPVNAVLREHVGILKEAAEKMQKEAIEFKERILNLEKENKHLKEELAKYSETEQMIKYKGALFLKKSDGTFEDVVYCPKCHNATFSFEPSVFPFSCEACNWYSPFKGHELPRILDELKKSV